LKWKNKVYGKAEFWSEECFKAEPDFDNGIVCKQKTFFPANWSREKAARVILQASKNRLKPLGVPKNNQQKYLCKGINNIQIDIVIDSDDVIISAYPSTDNF
jgi:hypothetical protein